MIAMTTSNSIRVNADRRERNMNGLPKGRNDGITGRKMRAQAASGGARRTDGSQRTPRRRRSRALSAQRRLDLGAASMDAGLAVQSRRMKDGVGTVDRSRSERFTEKTAFHVGRRDQSCEDRGPFAGGDARRWGGWQNRRLWPLRTLRTFARAWNRRFRR